MTCASDNPVGNDCRAIRVDAYNPVSMLRLSTAVYRTLNSPQLNNKLWTTLSTAIPGLSSGCPQVGLYLWSPLFPYTKTAENSAEQVITGELAGYFIQRLLCVAQFFRNQFTGLQAFKAIQSLL